MLESTKEQITQRYDKKLNAALSAEKTNRKDVNERLTESEKEKEKISDELNSAHIKIEASTSSRRRDYKATGQTSAQRNKQNLLHKKTKGIFAKKSDKHKLNSTLLLLKTRSLTQDSSQLLRSRSATKRCTQRS